MAISTKDIRKRIEDGLSFASSGNLSSLEVLQLSDALDTLKTSKYAVNTLADLPLASENTGRFVYVESVGDYRYSNGEAWVRQYDSTLVTQEDLWGWGSNGNGRLGDNTTVSRSSPASVVGGFTDWCQVSAGRYHTAAVRSNGSLWTWGENNCGRLGDGTTVNKSSPVSVVGGFTDWCQVGAGTCHTAAVRTNGTLWAWGCNSLGQIGDGTITSRSSPVSVVGGFIDWCQVSAGNYHTAAVRTNGTLWSWGENGSGRLGDGTTTNRISPVSVIGGFTDWCQVSASLCHTAAVRTNGTLWAWGYNAQGLLGDGTTTPRSSPVSVIGGFTDWCQVSSGDYHTAAVRTNGTLWSWGQGGAGRLGDGTITNRSSPISVVGGFTDWCQVSVGRAHTAAVRTNGTLWSWGYNSQGQIGDGTAIPSRLSPVSVMTGIEPKFWKRVSAGFSHTIALATTTKKGFNTP